MAFKKFAMVLTQLQDHVPSVVPAMSIPHFVKVGDKIRTVSMSRCMGQEPGEAREGRVKMFDWIKCYGDTKFRWFLLVDFQDQMVHHFPADQRLWTRGQDGVWEYRY